MPPEQYKFQMATQDFQSARQTLRRKTGQAVEPVPRWVSCNLYISGWLEKSTSARDKFAPKTNLAVSSAELTCCLVYECKIRILTFVYLVIC